jgi:hypothetical protein
MAAHSPVSTPNVSLFPTIFQYIITNYVKQPDQINITNDEIVDVLRDKSNYINFIQFIEQDITDEKSSTDSDEYAPDDYLLARHWSKGLPQYAIYDQYHRFSDYEKGLKILRVDELINEGPAFINAENINEVVGEPLFGHLEYIHFMDDFNVDLEEKDEKSSIAENALINETLEEMNRIINEYTIQPQLDIISHSIGDSDEKYNDEKEPEKQLPIGGFSDNFLK